MSNTVDDRIVSMQFDNAQFEKAVSQTISTLGHLDKALQLEDGAKGFSNLNKAVGTVSFSKIQNGIESLQSSFSVWGVVARRAIENVVDTIEGKLMRAINKVTMEPITDGFKEYELKMGSIQTIMASTGEDLRTVKGYLEDLNTYSDKTIYSFSDMTSNIGKFTNAGVKLEDAVLAIKGISNEAAISGANANEASRAMYNFSQALSSGYVKLIDWKSIENANMATVGFKDALLETAVAMKTAKKNADGTFQILTTDNNGKTMKDAVSATRNFNDSLSNQWMTTEVLTETLRQYATDVRTLTKDEKGLYEEHLKELGYNEVQIKNIEHLGMKAADAATEVKTWTMMTESLMEAIGSGWATTFELIIGDFEQAKKLWTSINDVLSGIVDSASDARNQFLKGVLGNNVWGEQWQYMKSLGVVTDEFKDKLKELAQKGGWDIDALIEKYGSFDATLQAGWLSADIFNDAIEATNGKLKKGSHELTEYGKAIERNALFALDTGVKPLQKIIDAGYDYTTVLSLIKAHVRGFDITQGKLTDTQIRSITTNEKEQESLRNLAKTAEGAEMSLAEVSETLTDYTNGFFDSGYSGRTAILDTLANGFRALGQVIVSVKDATLDVFTIMSPETIQGYLISLEELSEGLELTDDQMHAIRSIAGKLLRPIKELTDAFGRWLAGMAIPATLELFGAGFDALKGGFYVFGEVADTVATRMRDLQGVFQTNVFDPLQKQLEIHVMPRWYEFRQVLKDIPKYYDKFATFMMNERSGWYRIGEDASESFGTFLDTLKNTDKSHMGIVSLFNLVKTASEQLGTELWSSFTTNSQIDDVVSKPINTVTEQVGKLSEYVNGLSITSAMREAGDAFTYFGKSVSKIKINNLPQFFREFSVNMETLKNRLKSVAYQYTGLDDFENKIVSLGQAVKNNPFVVRLGNDFKLFGDRMKSVREMMGSDWTKGFASIFAKSAFKNLGKDVWSTISEFTTLDETIKEVGDLFNSIPFVQTAKGFIATTKESFRLWKMSKKLSGGMNTAISKAFGTGMIGAIERFKKTLHETFILFKRGPFTNLPKTLPKLFGGIKDFAVSLKEAFDGLNLFQKAFGGIGLGVKKTMDFVFGPDNAVSKFITDVQKVNFTGMFKQLKTPIKNIGQILTGKKNIKSSIKDGGEFVNKIDTALSGAVQLSNQFGRIRGIIKSFTGIELPFTGEALGSFATDAKKLLRKIDFKQFYKKTDKDTQSLLKSIRDTWKISFDRGFGIKEGRFFDVVFGDVRKSKVMIFQWMRDVADHLDSATSTFFSYNPILKALGLDNSTKPMFGTFVRNFQKTFDQFITKPFGTIGFVITDFEKAVKRAFGAIGEYIKEAIKPFIDLDSIISDIKLAWMVFNQVTETALKPFLAWNNDIEFGKRLDWLKQQYGNFFRYIIDSIKKYSKLDEAFAALKKGASDLGKRLDKFLFGDASAHKLGVFTSMFGLLGKAIKYLWNQLANSALGKFLKPIFMIDFVLRDIIAAVKKFVHQWQTMFKIFDAAGLRPRLQVYVGTFKRSFGTLISDIKAAFVNNTPVDFFVNAVKGKFKELHDWLSKFKWFQSLENFAKTNEVMIIFTKVIKAVGKALKEIFTSSVEAGGFFNLLYKALSAIASVVFDRVGKALDRLQENFKVLKERANELSKGSGFEILFNVFNFLADSMLALAGIDLSGFNKMNLKVIDGIKSFAGGVKKVLGSLFDFKGLTEALGPAFTRMYKSIRVVTSAEQPFGEKLKGVFIITSNFFRALTIGFVKNEKLRKILLTLGDAVRSLGAAFITIVAIHIPNLFTKIAETLGPLLEKLKLKDRLFAFADGIKTLFDKIQNGGAIEFIVEKIKSLIEAVQGFVDLSAIDFSGFAGDKTLFGSISKFVDQFKGFGMSDKQLEAFHAFLDSLGSTGKTLNDVLSQFGINPEKLSGLLGLFQAIGKIKVMFSAADFIADVAGVFKVGKSLAGMFDSIGSAAKAYKKSLKAQTFKDIATGVLMIAGAMALLSLINPDRLVKVAGMMAIVIAAIAFLVMQFNDYKELMSRIDGGAAFSPLQTFAEGAKDALGKFVKLASIGIAVLGVALGLVLFAKAVLMFTDILSSGKCISGIVMAGVVVAALAVIGGILAKIGNGLTGLGTAFLGLAAAVWIISKTINDFTNIDQSAIDKAIWVAFGIGAVIAALMLVRAMTGSDLTGLAGTIIGLAAAVWIMTTAVERIGKMQGGRFKGMLVVAGLLATMAGAIWLIGRLPVDEKTGPAVTSAANALMGVAKAMNLLAIVMVIIGKIGVKDLWSLVVGFAALVAPVVAIGVALHLIAKYIPNAEKAAKAVFTMATAMTMVSAAMVIMALIPRQALIKGALALLGVAVAMAIVIAAAGKFSGNIDWKALASLAAFFTLLTVAMIALGKLLTGDQAWVGFLGMLGIMATAIGSLWLLSKIGPGLAPTTAALIALAAAFTILTVAMVVIGTMMTGEQIAQGLAGIFVPLALLIGALAILSLMSSGIFMVGTGFLFLGAGLLMAAAAVGIFCGIFPGLVASILDAAPAVVEALANLGGKIAGWFKGIGDWIGNKIRGDADESKAEADRTASEVKATIQKRNDEINQIMSEKANQNGGSGMAEKIRKDGADAIAAADETTPVLEEKLGKLSTLIDFPTGDEDKTNTLADAVHALTGNATTAIDEDTPGLRDKAQELFGALSGEGMDVEALTNGTNIKDTLLGSLSDPTAFEGVASDNIGSYLSGMTTGLENTDLTPLAKGIGLDMDTGMKEGVEQNSSLVTNVLSTLASNMISTTRTGLDSASPSQEFHNIGMDTALGLRNGLNAGAPLVKSAMETFTAGIVAKGLESPDKMSKAATKSMSGYVKAISDKTKDAKKAAETAATNAASAANKYTNFYTTGRHCVQGLIDGIRSKTNEAKQAARELGNAVSSATSGSVEVRSPSRVFMRIGAFIVAGLVNGITNNAKTAARAASDMGDDTIDAVANAMAILGRIVDEDIEYTPKITPVVDLSAAQFGFSRLNTMSDNLQMSIDGAINSKWSQLDAMYDRLNGMTVGTDNSDVVASINSLKADIAMLGESVANMKVVLNRKVVGQIDNGLGQQQLLANRGV